MCLVLLCLYFLLFVFAGFQFIKFPSVPCRQISHSEICLNYTMHCLHRFVSRWVSVPKCCMIASWLLSVCSSIRSIWNACCFFLDLMSFFYLFACKFNSVIIKQWITTLICNVGITEAVTRSHTHNKQTKK